MIWRNFLSLFSKNSFIYASARVEEITMFEEGNIAIYFTILFLRQRRRDKSAKAKNIKNTFTWRINHANLVFEEFYYKLKHFAFVFLELNTRAEKNDKTNLAPHVFPSIFAPPRFVSVAWKVNCLRILLFAVSETQSIFLDCEKWFRH